MSGAAAVSPLSVLVHVRVLVLGQKRAFLMSFDQEKLDVQPRVYRIRTQDW
jgi:hypothetical protein